MHAKTANKQTVAVVVFEGVSLFELSVVCEIFGDQDGTEIRGPWYNLLICGAGGRGTSVRSDRGLRVDVTHGLRSLVAADTVVVPPLERRGAAADQLPQLLLDALRQAHRRGARLVSLCTGAFILAAAGLLDGRPATTHWAECRELARLYPAVQINPDVLYVDDGDVLTSAGSAACIDLCLHLVRTDFGADVAAELARELVVAPYRDGGQAQYIRTPLPDLETDMLFTETFGWLQEHLGDQVTVADLAARSAMSRRTFARRFLDTTGTTPYQWLLRQRVQLAQQLLESTDQPVDTIATRCGFATPGNLRKHFARVVHTTPVAYRRTFSTIGG